MEVWRRHRKATSAGPSAAPYSVYHGLYGEAAVSSVASAVALAEVGQFREAVQYLQKAAKALYEAAKEVFEQLRRLCRGWWSCLWRRWRGYWLGSTNTRRISS
jgi:hypothetical protein